MILKKIQINKEYIIKFKFICFLIIFLLLYFINRTEFPLETINSSLNNKKESGLYTIYKISNQSHIYLNAKNLNYFFSFKYNITQLEYNIHFYDKSYHLIKPSDIILLYGLRIICYMQVINSNINIYSIAAIEDDQKFTCIELFNNNDKIKFGIKILNLQLNSISTYIFFCDNIINYAFLNHKNNTLFESKSIRNYSYRSKEVNKKSLGKIYIRKPHCSSKQNLITKDNNWSFRNINNRYFCFCKGENCNYININQKCKYLFYLYLIDNNKNVYNKSNYLLADFLQKTKSSDDALPVFREMIKQNISAHYMTEKIEIYEEYCQNEKNCLKIIPILKKKYILDGDFFEKYFSVILKLKVVVSSIDFNSFNNIFMYIDYITYINLGHGVKFFKQFLYKDFSSHLKYDKVLLPPSEKIISIAKKYHWADENIIKICLPRWDKYDIYKRQISLNSNTKENYKNIFLMFTWRKMKNNYKISTLYIKNILNIINNQLLNAILINNNITFYFSLHHMILKL
jgi:hypothetical protein